MGEPPAATPDPRDERMPRDFRISDAMALIAGTALALAGGLHIPVLMAETAARLGRVALAHRGDLPGNWPAFRAATGEPLRNVAWYAMQAAEMPLVGLTPAFLLVRMRRPRPAARALLRQPGMVAALAMVFGAFWGTGLVAWALPGRVDSVTLGPLAVGGAVAVAWGSLAAGRWWAPESSWVDRLGRGLGWLAIGTASLGLIVFRI